MTRLEYWQRGVADFNENRWWHAHESWEQGWRELPQPERNHLQAMIQVCGVLYLLQKGRLDPAARLARRALELLKQAALSPNASQVDSRVVIPQADDYLRDLLADLDSSLPVGDTAVWTAPWLKRAALLRSRLANPGDPE